MQLLFDNKEKEFFVHKGEEVVIITVFHEPNGDKAIIEYKNGEIDEVDKSLLYPVKNTSL